MENSKAVGFKDVKVFAADPWYKAQPGYIKNLKISMKSNMNIVSYYKGTPPGQTISFLHCPNHLSPLLPNLGKLIIFSWTSKKKNGLKAARIIICASSC